MSNSCANCRFFFRPINNAMAMGSCRRYPSQQTVSANYWCGEHSAEIPQPQAAPQPTEAPRKRRGRPPKAVKPVDGGITIVD